MGYTTDFYGSLEFNKPVEPWLVDYIDKFNRTRRMKRDNEKIKELFPNWKELCFNGELGENGEYFVGGLGFMGQDKDGSVIDGNMPPITQPGLWCQWVIQDNQLVWDEGEKFYYYEDWLEYLIDNFFEPFGYVLNGDIEWNGEDDDDFGIIHVEDNCIEMKYGIRVMSMREIETEDLIAELEGRGYTVSV